MRKITKYKEILNLLTQLHIDYPTFSMGQHIATAVADYGDFWGLTDKEFLFALEKYQAELSLDNENIASPDYVDKIIKDGEGLFDNKEEEEEDF